MALTQREMVLRHLQQFGSITPHDAMREYGIMRLAARIAELRMEHPITSTLEPKHNRFGEKVYLSRYKLGRLPGTAGNRTV